jgi:CheY-like chemotaxis protein
MNDARLMKRPLLFIEDDEDDVYIIRRTLEREEIYENTHFVQNGQMAVEYLEPLTTGTLTSNALPLIIFLDLNMPLMNGLEFLQWRREQPVLQMVPVLVFTSSDNRQDIINAYQLGANAYLIKPMSVSELSSLLKSVQSFWLNQNRYPG